jgi:adenylate cyclase
VNPKNFFAELRRRSVYKVAIAYGIVAWLLIQISTQVFPFFEIPNWTNEIRGWIRVAKE